MHAWLFVSIYDGNNFEKSEMIDYSAYIHRTVINHPIHVYHYIFFHITGSL